MAVNEKREYVLLSRKWTKDFLVFWGTETADDEKRSFSGYTMNLSKCEKYTKEELKAQCKGRLFWEGQHFWELELDESYAIKISDAVKMGQRMDVVYL